MQAARGTSLSDSDPTPPVADPAARRRSLRIFLAVAVSAYLLDLLTKVAAVRYLDGRDPVPVFGDVLRLNLVFNPGAAFSLGTSYTLVLTVIAVIAAIVVLRLARRVVSPLWAVGLGALLGGVLGNLTDRIFRAPGVGRGHVIDFLQLPNWPVFNIADICINVAAGIIVLQAIRGVSHDGVDRP